MGQRKDKRGNGPSFPTQEIVHSVWCKCIKTNINSHTGWMIQALPCDAVAKNPHSQTVPVLSAVLYTRPPLRLAIDFFQVMVTETYSVSGFYYLLIASICHVKALLLYAGVWCTNKKKTLSKLHGCCSVAPTAASCQNASALPYVLLLPST